MSNQNYFLAKIPEARGGKMCLFHRLCKPSFLILNALSAVKLLNSLNFETVEKEIPKCTKSFFAIYNLFFLQLIE